MSDAKRKTVKTEILDIGDYTFQGNIVDIICRLQHLRSQYGDTIEVEMYNSYAHYDEAYITVDAIYYRDETDAEMQKRLTKAKKARATAKENRAKAKVKKEQQERKQLAKLLEKYGEEA